LNSIQLTRILFAKIKLPVRPKKDLPSNIFDWISNFLTTSELFMNIRKIHYMNPQFIITVLLPSSFIIYFCNTLTENNEHGNYTYTPIEVGNIAQIIDLKDSSTSLISIIPKLCT